jgi:AcrR family transcriptional regulator
MGAVTGGHREALLLAARRLLEERGFARVTTRDLVAASGTNLASIGYHFGSKDGLLTQVLVGAFRDWVSGTADAARRALVREPKVALGMHAALEQLTAGLRTDRLLILSAAEAIAAAGRNPDLQAHLRAAFRESVTSVGEALGEMVDLDHDQARALAMLLIAIHDGLATQSILDPDGGMTADSLAVALAGLSRLTQE